MDSMRIYNMEVAPPGFVFIVETDPKFLKETHLE